MVDRPIIFSAPMVRALLEGHKTQTRRVLRPATESLMCVACGCTEREIKGGAECVHILHDLQWVPCSPPVYRVGDRLWVREGFAYFDDQARRDHEIDGIIYRAQHEEAPTIGPRVDERWRPSIHQPRWASRLTLTVTDVRVQRVQEISEDDARAEGMVWQEPTDEEHGQTVQIDGVWLAPGTRQGWGMTKELRDRPQWGATAAFAFRCTWNSLHGPGVHEWDRNPWVVALTFAVERRNIDA